MEANKSFFCFIQTIKKKKQKIGNKYVSRRKFWLNKKKIDLK